jgi:hypothetical protein
LKTDIIDINLYITKVKDCSNYLFWRFSMPRNSASNLPKSTYCSDPEATHTVDVLGGPFGGGIYGYYTNEIDAHRVRKWVTDNGATVAQVNPYNPNAPVVAGMHKFVELSLNGYE